MTWLIRCFFTFLLSLFSFTGKFPLTQTGLQLYSQLKSQEGKEKKKSRRFGASVDVNVSSAKYQNALGRNNCEENTPGIYIKKITL